MNTRSKNAQIFEDKNNNKNPNNCSEEEQSFTTRHNSCTELPIGENDAEDGSVLSRMSKRKRADFVEDQIAAASRKILPRGTKRKRANNGQTLAIQNDESDIPYILDDDEDFDNVLGDLSFESVQSREEEVIKTKTAANSAEDDVSSRKKQYKKHKWVLDSKWPSLKDAAAYLHQNNFVKYKVNDKHSQGIKIHYRCKLVPKHREVWCNRQYEAFCPDDSKEVIVNHNSLEHNHEEVLGPKKKISADMIQFIIEQFKKKVVRYESILEQIQEARQKENILNNEPDPTKAQIAYRLKLFREQEAPTVVNLGDLMNWCSENSKFPCDPNEAFVLSSCCSRVEEDRFFRFVISTPHILDTFKSVELICIDSTYKLNWHGFPLTILGTIDRARKFHPIAYACTSNETAEDYSFVFTAVANAIKKYFGTEFAPTTNVADGADAIRNAFYSSFQSAKKDIMCFAHVLRNVTKRKFTAQNNKNLLIVDIQKIQLAPDKKTFKLMTKLFLEKWKNIEVEFVEYFKKQWLGVHCNWYEGASNYTPSTNNALEGYNSVIKRKVTLRRRLPLQEFLGSMKHMAAEKSNDLYKQLKIFASEPTINKKLLQNAALLEQSSFKAFKAKKCSGDLNTYLLPSSSCAAENANEAHWKEIEKRKWKSFDEFIQYGYQKFWVVQLDTTDKWKIKSTCTCPVFGKEFICKHIVALAFREKIAECPESINPTKLTEKKRRPGRVKNSEKALLIG